MGTIFLIGAMLALVAQGNARLGKHDGRKVVIDELRSKEKQKP